MCDPVFLSIALGVASSVAGYAAQNAEAKAVHENATTAFHNDQQAASLRQIQEADAMSQKQQQTNLEEAVKVSEVRLSAGSAGIGGVSVDNLVNDVRRQAARNRTTQFDNTKMAIQQIQLEKKASRATNQGRINMAPRPSPLSLVAGIGGAVMDGYNQKNKRIA